MQTCVAVGDGRGREPEFEVMRPDLEAESVTLGKSSSLSEPQLSPLVTKGANSGPQWRVCEDGLISNRLRLTMCSFCLAHRSPSPRLGGGRVDNEEEEEEGEGALEQSCPPNPYQLHPPPEGSCTTDGEMPAGLWGVGGDTPVLCPRGVSCAPVPTVVARRNLPSPQHWLHLVQLCQAHSP